MNREWMQPHTTTSHQSHATRTPFLQGNGFPFLFLFYTLPSAQRSQSIAPLSAEYEPAKHCLLLTEPSTHEEPGGQEKQPSCVKRPVSLPKVPAAQGFGVAEPSLQKPPSVHTSHAVPPSWSWKEPALQAAHVPARGSSE